MGSYPLRSIQSTKNCDKICDLLKRFPSPRFDTCYILNNSSHYQKNIIAIQSYLIRQITISLPCQVRTVIFSVVIILHVDYIYLWAALTGRCAYI